MKKKINCRSLVTFFNKNKNYRTAGCSVSKVIKKTTCFGNFKHVFCYAHDPIQP